MTFRNPLNRFRGAELKEPILKRRALLAREVRKVLAAHPDGMTSDEVKAKVPNAGEVLSYLRRTRFARMSPWNAKANNGRGELWFASEPRTKEEAETEWNSKP